MYPPVPPGPFPGEPARPDSFASGVYAELLERRVVFLRDGLDHDAATLVTAQLLTLDDEGGDAQPVTLVVNSGGGPVSAVPGVLDTIELLGCPVDTTCVGRAEGTAALVVAAGTGRRRCGPAATFRLRFPDVEAAGPADRLHREVESATQLQEGLVDRLAAITGQSRALVARDVERGRTLTAEEAVAYGRVDEVTSRGART